MPALPLNRKHYYTLEEYFVVERVGETRFEYWDGEIVCMNGGSLEHGDISSNIHLLLGNHLKGKTCRAYTEGQAIKVPQLLPYRYPDASVVCGDIHREIIGGIEAITNPTILVEVVSPDSKEQDTKIKCAAYQNILSLREYLIIEQESPTVTLYTRLENDIWHKEIIVGLEKSFQLSSIECQLEMVDIYENVSFSKE